MALLEFQPITVPIRHLLLKSCVGLNSYKGVDQSHSQICWAAAVASVLRTTGLRPAATDEGFAVEFWRLANDCDDVINKVGNDYNEGVSNLECVLDFAKIKRNVFDTGLEVDQLKDALGEGWIVLCILSVNSTRHVVLLWHCCDTGSGIYVNVHDPAKTLTGTDREVGPFLDNVAYAAGRP